MTKAYNKVVGQNRRDLESHLKSLEDINHYKTSDFEGLAKSFSVKFEFPVSINTIKFHAKDMEVWQPRVKRTKKQMAEDRLAEEKKTQQEVQDNLIPVTIEDRIDKLEVELAELTKQVTKLKETVR